MERMRSKYTNKSAKRLLALLLVLCLCVSLAACSGTGTVSAPTDPPESTQPPGESPETTDGTGEYSYIYNSRFADCTGFARAALAGETPDGSLVLETDASRVYFDYLDGRFAAFSKVRITKEAFDSDFPSAYECMEPIARFPKELGDMALERISALYAEKTGDPAEKTVPLEGWFGDDYAVLVYTPGGTDSSPQVNCIFRTDDGENWYEFGNYPSIDFPLNGACIVSDRVGFVCVGSWRGYVTMDESNVRRLFVFMTEDGGETWRDLGLELPESFASCENYAFSPLFEGDHGVIPVSSLDRDTTSPARYRFSWFETDDGGRTWTFVGPEE